MLATLSRAVCFFLAGFLGIVATSHCVIGPQSGAGKLAKVKGVVWSGVLHDVRPSGWYCTMSDL
jgi:hypothetical protein